MCAKPYWQKTASAPAATAFTPSAGTSIPPAGAQPASFSPGKEFEVRFSPKSFSGESVQNLEFAGTGRLAIGADGQVFRFFGKERKLLFAKDKTLEFSATDISDVMVEGAIIHFTTTKGTCGEKREPFYFYARNAGDAIEIAELLPTTHGPGGERAFAEKLQRLPFASHPLGSVTTVLVLANVAVFLLATTRYGMDFWSGRTMEPFLDFGASNGAAFADGEWWRLPVSMFMHFGFLHLGFNMWALAKAGVLLERLMGRALFSLTYLASGLGGGLASIWWYGDKVWSAGASGAIFGVYGATLGVLGRLRGEIPGVVMRPLVTSMVLFAGYNLLLGMQKSGIDNACHVGGLLSGLLLGTLTALPLDLTARARKQRAHLITGATALVAIVAVGLAAAPHFDYRMSEELALQKVLRQIVAEEKETDARFQAAAADFDAGRLKPPDFQVQVEQFMAFSTRNIARLNALELTPGFRTDRQRSDVLQALEKKAATGRMSLKFGEESKAFGTMAEEFSTERRSMLTRLENLIGTQQSLENAVRFTKDELLPFYARWREKLNALALTTKPGIEMRAKLLTSLESDIATAQFTIRELVEWFDLEQEFLDGYNDIRRRLAAKIARPAEMREIVDWEFFPYLKRWEQKFSALKLTRPELQTARQYRLGEIKEAAVSMKSARDRVEAGAVRQP